MGLSKREVERVMTNNSDSARIEAINKGREALLNGTRFAMSARETNAIQARKEMQDIMGVTGAAAEAQLDNIRLKHSEMLSRQLESQRSAFNNKYSADLGAAAYKNDIERKVALRGLMNDVKNGKYGVGDIDHARSMNEAHDWKFSDSTLQDLLDKNFSGEQFDVYRPTTGNPKIT